MMLQAADLGLGTTYVGMFEPEKLLAAFPEMAGTVPIALLPLGYPAEGAHPPGSIRSANLWRNWPLICKP